ncbi:MAG TPA: GNAT family protein [Vicinamibacterales bacterium]|nr:GNAT family protein [Vicinamibacterales bacterium]
MNKPDMIETDQLTIGPSASPGERASDWRITLPELVGRRVILREPRAGDASALFSLLSTEEVSRFISPPPTAEGFERYIGWTQRQRVAGQYVCFAIVPVGADAPIGLIHVRALSPAFLTADWGFAIGSEFWGTGVFTEAAELVLEFAFDVLDIHRLEARAALCNGRGNGAMKKLGAEREGVLRHSFVRDGEFLDQVLWSILQDDWRQQQEKAPRRSRVVH